MSPKEHRSYSDKLGWHYPSERPRRIWPEKEETLTFKELVTLVAKRLEMPRKTVARVLRFFLAAIAEKLYIGKTVELRRLGRFKPTIAYRPRQRRVGKNVTAKEATRIYFSATRQLREGIRKSYYRDLKHENPKNGHSI